MGSIQQIAEQFINQILDIDFTRGLAEGLQEASHTAKAFVCRVAEEKLMEIDQTLFENPSLRQGWVVEHKDVPRDLLSEHGLLQFSRRYYRNKQTGLRRYLVDDLVGLDPYERVEKGLTVKLCQSAVYSSYQQSTKACCDNQVSRQTVMNKTRQVTGCKLDPVPQRPDVPIIHIQADEDHVALQTGGKDTIVKLAAIHEPAIKVGKDRWQLPQRHLLTSCNKESVEEFWLRVAHAIYERYGDRDDLKVYIHGDGAAWIKTGLDWIKNSRFVLDRFHFIQYLNAVVGQHSNYRQYIMEHLVVGNRLKIVHMVEAIMGSDLCSEQAGKAFLSYLRNNWNGIQIWYDPSEQAGGSCAEGLVSHVLSSRLSSRPLGWSRTGLETISRLRVHVLNGGCIEPGNVSVGRRRAIRPTRTLRERLSFEEYDESRLLQTSHRSSAQYRLYKAITEGGLAV